MYIIFLLKSSKRIRPARETIHKYGALTKRGLAIGGHPCRNTGVRVAMAGSNLQGIDRDTFSGSIGAWERE